MSHKLHMIDDDNKSFRTLPCGYTAIGPTNKRILSIKLHKKKCELCSMMDLNPKELAKINGSDVPLKKQKYLNYIKGDYNTQSTYLYDQEEKKVIHTIEY